MFKRLVVYASTDINSMQPPLTTFKTDIIFTNPWHEKIVNISQASANLSDPSLLSINSQI